MLWRTEVPIKHKCEETNKKGVQKKTPTPHENIIGPVIPQLDTVQCPKISNPPKIPHHP